MLYNYDIIVVGAGHAGCEAAASAANMGSKVLLITMDMTKFAQMSCNPAIGGIAKGQIVREIDALGGFTGIVTDKTMIQFRMLNRSKGPAMWSPRAQCDRTKFTIEWRKILENTPNLFFWQDTVKSLVIDNGSVVGVVTQLGVTFNSKAVVITSGTFQNGLIHVGRTQVEGGRISEPSSKGVSDQLREYGFEVGRMKTGTPARIDGRSVNFSILDEQKNDEGDGF
jgi:tRNA uridine 5-carboxymethylaminomethyl modification enzyme